MSSWQEYGYPDLAGTPFQTALHGLLLALRERFEVAGGDLSNNLYLDICDKVNIVTGFPVVPISNATAYTDSLFNLAQRYYRLPNGEEFLLKTAADYLGEDLVDLNPYAGSVIPVESITDDLYPWCMQRYRMLNVMTQFNAGYYGGITSKRKNVFLFYDTIYGESPEDVIETTENYFSLSGEVGVARHYYNEKDFYRGNWQEVYCPIKWKNQHSLPCDLMFKFKALKSGVNTSPQYRDDELISEVYPYPNDEDRKYRYEFNDFGLGLKFNDYNVFSVPVNAPKDAEVDLLNAGFPNIFEIVSRQQHLTPDSRYRNYECTTGFRATDVLITADYKKSFQFYDEIKVE